MKTVGDLLQLLTAFLQERLIDKPRRLSEELVAFVLKCRRMDLYLEFDRPVEEQELSILRDMLKRCGKGEPVEYVTGEIDFLNCKIAVDSRVLIPRQETEILVDKIQKQLKSTPLQPSILYDLCAGSGCIGIALKKTFPELTVILVDLSQEALEVALQNAKNNDVSVEVIHGDFLTDLPHKADFVVCNPPYISKNEYLNLQPSVRCFEPYLALVGGERGTEFYERIANELPLFLNPGARVFLEIGSMQAASLQGIFSVKPWVVSRVEKDWAGLDRFFFLENQ